MNVLVSLACSAFLPIGNATMLSADKATVALTIAIAGAIASAIGLAKRAWKYQFDGFDVCKVVAAVLVVAFMTFLAFSPGGPG